MIENSVLDIIFYAVGFCGMLMAIILVVSQYIILAQNSRCYEAMREKEMERDESIELIKNRLEFIIEILKNEPSNNR